MSEQPSNTSGDDGLRIAPAAMIVLPLYPLIVAGVPVQTPGGMVTVSCASSAGFRADRSEP